LNYPFPYVVEPLWHSVDYLFAIYLESHANLVSICSEHSISTIKVIQGVMPISCG
jgi:hypothetical protein